MRTLVVIPARYGSTRLPAKVLLKETGKYLMQHTYEQVLKCKLADRIIIATDDKRIYKAGQSFGAEVRMTSKDHSCGTERIAEVARYLPYNYIINVQADEPEIDPEAIDRIIATLQPAPLEAKPRKDNNLSVPNEVTQVELLPDRLCRDVIPTEWGSFGKCLTSFTPLERTQLRDKDISNKLKHNTELSNGASSKNASNGLRSPENLLPHSKSIDIATLVTPLKRKDIPDPNKVKVQLDGNNFAVSFSRLCLPPDGYRGRSNWYRHLGIYGYKKSVLLKFVRLPQTDSEKELRLEQLRALENGFNIKAIITRKAFYGIDTVDDYKKFMKKVTPSH